MTTATPPSSNPELGLEELIERTTSLPAATGEQRDAFTLFADRLHLARNSSGELELFIEGDRESFGQNVFGRSLEHGLYRESKGRREFAALVIRAPRGGRANRPMGHLSYEALQAIAKNPRVTNSELLDVIGPYLRLVIEDRALSDAQQLGLTGELIFLQQLLMEGRDRGLPPISVLHRWKGWDSASRDFKSGNVAVEVKTTSGTARQHWVHPVYQLLPEYGTNEQVFVFSVGLKRDRSHAYKLTTAIERVLVLLDAESREEFWGCLALYGGIGIEPGQWRQYELESGFAVTHAPALFRVDQLSDILRPNSFVGNQPPARVLDLEYQVSLEGLPTITREDRAALISEMLDEIRYPGPS